MKPNQAFHDLEKWRVRCGAAERRIQELEAENAQLRGLIQDFDVLVRGRGFVLVPTTPEARSALKEAEQ